MKFHFEGKKLLHVVSPLSKGKPTILKVTPQSSMLLRNHKTSQNWMAQAYDKISC